jgi:hypothetical protein
VADRLGRPPVAGLQQGQVAEGLAAADADLGAEGVGQLPGGPSPVLADQRGEPPGHRRPPGVVRGGAGGVGAERLRPPITEPLEGGPNGVRVAIEVAGDARRRPAGVREQDHLQAIPCDGREVGAAESLKFGTLSVREVSAKHETFYASPARCLVFRSLVPASGYVRSARAGR